MVRGESKSQRQRQEHVMDGGPRASPVLPKPVNNQPKGAKASEGTGDP